MNKRILWLTGALTAAFVLAGCSGPTNESQPGAANSTGTSPAASADAPSAPSASPLPGSTGPAAAPATYTPPPPGGPFEPYSVAEGVSPAVAKACSALNVAQEVFATIGKSTLRSDSLGSVTEESLVCVFATGDLTANSPNYLAVGTRKDSAGFFKTAATDVSAGVKAQDISGIGDSARFYGGSRPAGVGHVLFALKGTLVVTVSASFTEVPTGADLVPMRYGTIANKVYVR